MSSTPRDSAMAGKNGHSLISQDKFRELFEALLSGQQHNKKLHAAGNGAHSAHDEAGPAGLVLDLRAEDTLLLPSSAHFAHGLKKTESAATHSHSNGHSHLSARLAGAIASAVQNRIEKNNGIVLVLFSFAESNEGLPEFDEAFAVAEASKLPILFVLESRSGFTSSAAFKEKHPAFPYIAVDAHDVVAVYRVAQESIVRTREGGGPAVIELAFYHPEDPVEKMHRYLVGKGFPADDWRNTASIKYR